MLFFLVKAMKILHERGTKTVVITSSELGDSKTLIALGSSVNGQCCWSCYCFFYFFVSLKNLNSWERDLWEAEINPSFKNILKIHLSWCSLLAHSPGPLSWPSLLALSLGPLFWPSFLACSHDPLSWPPLLALSPGPVSWPSLLVLSPGPLSVVTLSARNFKVWKVLLRTIQVQMAKQ